MGKQWVGDVLSDYLLPCACAWSYLCYWDVLAIWISSKDKKVLLVENSFYCSPLHLDTFIKKSCSKALMRSQDQMCLMNGGQLINSVTQSCPTLCNPMDCCTSGFPVPPEPAQTHVHRVGDATQPSHPLSSPSPPKPSIFPSIRVFSNESALHTRWQKYQNFSFSISPSNEYSG